MKRFTAILLCIAMLTALCACGGGGAETTVPTTTPAPVAAEVYAEAAGKLAALENAELVISYAETMELGEDRFETISKQTVTLLGLGTDAFAASVKETLFSGSLTVTAREVYTAGTAYSQLNSDGFKAEMTAEDYLDRLLPLMLVDAALYGTVEQDEAGIFTFTDATALESWCDNPYATLSSATATAELGEDGLPSKYTYKAAYTQAAADMELSVTMEIRTPETTEIAAPEKADEYLTVELIDVPALILLTQGYLDQSGAALSTSTDVVTCQAAGFAETTVTTLAAYGRDASTIGSFNTVYQFADMTTGSVEGYTMTETFNDGKLTTVIDGGDPETTDGITGYDMQEAIAGAMQYLIPDLSNITGYTLSVMGDTALLEYTCSDDFAKDAEAYYCQAYLGDANLLKNLASASAVTENGGFLGIDLTTGMPLSLGQTFTMTHTIDGQDYILSAASQMNVQLGSRDAYETITGEPLPAREPEELAKPVFYKVTGTNGETMWLLGTIHVGDERTAHLPQEIYDAFAASDALAVEFDTESYTASLMEDEEAIQAYIQAMIYTDGTNLKDHLKDETLYDNTVKLLKATGNYNANMALLTKPVFQFQTIDNFFMANGYRMSSDYGVDMQLMELAKEQEKEILSVESGEFQMDLLANLSDALQELLLKEVVEYGQFATNYGTEELFEMWCRGDEAELIQYLNEEEDDSDLTEEEKALYAEYENALGGMRNEDMLAVAQDYLNSGKTVFYAVGLAHLLTDDGLVNTLRDAGYTVELVSYAG